MSGKNPKDFSSRKCVTSCTYTPKSIRATNSPVETLISRFRSLSLQTPRNVDSLFHDFNVNKQDSVFLELSNTEKRLEQRLSAVFVSSTPCGDTSGLPPKCFNVSDETLRKILIEEHQRRKIINLENHNCNNNNVREVHILNTQGEEEVNSLTEINAFDVRQSQIYDMKNEESILERSIHEISELYVLLMKSSSNYAKNLPKRQITEITGSVFSEVVDERLGGMVTENQRHIVSESFLLNIDKDIDVFLKSQSLPKINTQIIRFSTIDKIKSFSESKLCEKNFTSENNVLKASFLYRNSNIKKLKKSKSLDEEGFNLKERESIRACLKDCTFTNISNDVWFTPCTSIASRSDSFPNLSKLSPISLSQYQENETETEVEIEKKLKEGPLTKTSFIPCIRDLSNSPISAQSTIVLSDTPSTINLSSSDTSESLSWQHTVSICSSEISSESQSLERKSSIDISSEEDEKSITDISFMEKESIFEGIILKKIHT